MTGNRGRWVLALCAWVPLLAQAPNTLTPEEMAAGWRLLFDGKTMDGWLDPAKKTPPGDAWTIDNGSLKPVRGARFPEDLVTAESFGDFELRFEWRISEGGNSGVKYRVQQLVVMPRGQPGQRFEDRVAEAILHPLPQRPERGEGYAVAFEYQVIDNARHPDARRGPKYQAGALYDMSPAVRDVTRPVGEFNQSRLVVRGNHAEHWLNGVKVVDVMLDQAAKEIEHRWGADSPVYRLLTQMPEHRTPITLQNHGDDAWFRNIKIRPLE